MDWLIWVIVIVLVIAIVWWLMNRNKARNSVSTHAPAAMEPSNTSPLPDAAAATAGVAGLAGVTNLGKAAAEGSGPAGEESISDEPSGIKAGRDEETTSGSSTGDLDDVTETHSPEPQPAETPGLTVEEPVIAAPVIEEPVIEEPVVDEPEVDTDAKLHSADAGDVDDWDAGSSQPAAAAQSPAPPTPAPSPQVTADDVSRADDAADKAEWESSWTDESGAPVHHHEYTDAHSPTLPGAESAAAEDSATSGHLAAEHPYGNGSSSNPGDGYLVKANAADMTYHDEDAAGYDDVTADVWFESAAHAEAAGFRPPRRNRH